MRTKLLFVSIALVWVCLAGIPVLRSDESDLPVADEQTIVEFKNEFKSLREKINKAEFSSDDASFQAYLSLYDEYQALVKRYEKYSVSIPNFGRLNELRQFLLQKYRTDAFDDDELTEEQMLSRMMRLKKSGDDWNVQKLFESLKYVDSDGKKHDFSNDLYTNGKLGQIDYQLLKEKQPNRDVSLTELENIFAMSDSSNGFYECYRECADDPAGIPQIQNKNGGWDLAISSDDREILTNYCRALKTTEFSADLTRPLSASPS
jgi:hypothetical protein